MSPDVDAVLAAVHAGSAGESELAAALAGAPVLFAVAAGRGDQALPWTVRIDDADYAVVCTSRAYADGLSEVPAFAELSGRDLAARWPANLNAFLNPGTSVALTLDARVMSSIGRTQERLSAGTSYAVGAPATPPEPDLVEAVRGALREVGGAREAYLIQFAATGSLARLVCGLVLDGPTSDAAAITSIASAVAHRYGPASTLDFVALDGRLLQSAAASVPAIR